MKDIVSAQEYLSQLPDDTNSLFSTIITQHCASSDVDFIEALSSILNDSSDQEIKQNSNYYFGAFYSLVVYHRHKGNLSLLRELLMKYDSCFHERPLFLFSKSALLSNENEEHKLRYALDLARECLDIINRDDNDYDNQYPGFYNHFATVVLVLLDNRYKVTDEELEKATAYISKLVNEHNYSTYNANYGRLLAHSRKYKEAEIYINKAIDIEQDDKRISKYSDLLIQLKSKQQIEILEERASKIEQDFSANRMEILEYLAFFSGVISFILVSSNIAINADQVENAVVVILTMLVSLLIAFSTFRLLLKRTKEDIKWAVSVGVISLFILIVIIAFIKL